MTLAYPYVFYIYLAVVLATVFLASSFTFYSVNTEWYDNLLKPSVANEHMLFGMVWAVLYILIFVGGYYGDIAVIQTRPTNYLVAVRILYGLQLLFNMLWCLAFFVFGWFWLAFVINILLVITIIGLMVLYILVCPLAFWVFLPYLVWSTFALYLTFVVMLCNPDRECEVDRECRSNRQSYVLP